MIFRRRAGSFRMSLSMGKTPDRAVRDAGARSAPGRFIYLGIALVIALAVVFGFGSTVEANLFHPTAPVPRVLYVHAAVFTAWDSSPSRLGS